MNYLTNHYRNKAEVLAQKIALLENLLSQTNMGRPSVSGSAGGPVSPTSKFRKLNEAKYDIPATFGEMEARKNDPSTVGVDEMLKILKGGGHPVMAGQNGSRGVSPEIRQEAIRHLETIKGHPQGPIKNYSEEHPVYKQGKAAHDFFLKHFPEFGVEDAIADSHDINRL